MKKTVLLIILAGFVFIGLVSATYFETFETCPADYWTNYTLQGYKCGNVAPIYAGSWTWNQTLGSNFGYSAPTALIGVADSDYTVSSWLHCGDTNALFGLSIYIMNSTDYYACYLNQGYTPARMEFNYVNFTTGRTQQSGTASCTGYDESGYHNMTIVASSGTFTCSVYNITGQLECSKAWSHSYITHGGAGTHNYDNVLGQWDNFMYGGTSGTTTTTTTTTTIPCRQVFGGEDYLGCKTILS